MVTIKQVISLVFGVLAVWYTFNAAWNLIMFLSKPAEIPNQYVWIYNLMDNRSRLETIAPALGHDMVYIIIFILQHSLMKSELYKSFMRSIGLDVAERAIYALTTSMAINYLLVNWSKATAVVLWQIDTSKNNALWYIFVFIHIFAWTIIYGGSLIMDLPELVGIKQIFYNIRDYAPPMAYRSFELRHLYGHVRHPSFSAFTLILWCTNLMSVDRFMLSIMLTLYMYIAWSTDRNDCIYHKCQLKQKFTEIKHQVQYR